MCTIALPLDSLVVFLDETGHEDLPKGHYVYGLGGCAVLASDLDTYIRNPWRNVRAAIKGDPNLPMHASADTRNLTPGQQSRIGEFFSTRPFMRVAVATTANTKISEPLKRIQILVPSLMQRILDVLRWTPAKSIALVFESNERTNRQVEKYVSQLEVTEEARTIPVNGYFMAKSANDPALEVADFIMHSVHGLARDYIAGRDAFSRRDFHAVFHSMGPKLTSFILLNEVFHTPQSE